MSAFRQGSRSNPIASHAALKPKPAETGSDQRPGGVSRPPFRALGGTAALLNSRSSVVAQLILAGQLSGNAPVQLGRKGNKGSKTKNNKTKKRKQVRDKVVEPKKQKVDIEEDERATETGERSEDSSEEDFRDQPLEKEEIESGRSSEDDGKQEKDEKEEKKEDGQSDSEDEAINAKHEPAKRHRGLVINYTKSRPTGEKVANKVQQSGLGAATGKLMADAKAIHKVLPEKSKGPTTITTALLLHKPTQLYKRFAFCNAPLMPIECRKVAEQLGYHVVKAPETHAEGQLIQYLYVRGPIYEHHNMGVDKDHCAECQILMKTYFGHDHYGTKAGKSKDVYNKYKSPSLLREAVGLDEIAPITKFRNKDGGKIKDK